MINHLETTEGPLDLEVWRYEKSLTKPQEAQKAQSELGSLT